MTLNRFLRMSLCVSVALSMTLTTAACGWILSGLERGTGGRPVERPRNWVNSYQAPSWEPVPLDPPADPPDVEEVDLEPSRAGLQRRLRGPLAKARQEFIAASARYVGVEGTPNKFTTWYAEGHGAAFLHAPWCAMFVSWVGNKLNIGPKVGEFAYTPYWVEWLQANKKWRAKPKPGSLVFYDWNMDDEVDHVGVVASHKGGYLYTIEGNVDGGKVERKVRARNQQVAGYGRPEFLRGSAS